MSNKQKIKMAGTIKQNLIGEKIMWFQQNMVPDISPYTPELTAELLLKYVLSLKHLEYWFVLEIFLAIK